MKTSHIILLSSLMALSPLTGCNQFDDIADGNNATRNAALATRNAAHQASAVPGRLIVKMKPTAMTAMVQGKTGQIELQRVPTKLQRAFNKIGVTRIAPLYPDYDKFRRRRAEAGLDRWMIITFDEAQPTATAATQMAKMGEFECVEMDYYLQIPQVRVTPLPAGASLTADRSTPLPGGFNDPLSGQQWNLYNDGSLNKASVAKADVNVLPAWNITTGSPKVIVSVVDGGVDFRHEDLQQNTDSTNSFNFVYDKDGKYKEKDLYPDSDGHGTHVAGIVAAVNNNGVGISSVAGGNGAADSGVRLINSQIFGKNSENSAGGAAGIVWGADHGAVISQNSWGYKYPGPGALPQHDKEAIDYFIKNAGMDENGNQREDSPMAGGVVIFAAGNDGIEFEAFPASYDKCIAVTSMAWDFSVSDFSTRGTWADIMAPGGDTDRFGSPGGILSTLPTSQSRSGYGFMQGTSMACPHVSAIAALIASKYGGKGFTNKALEAKLLAALRPYNIDDLNPLYAHRLGRGYIDATAALEDNNGIAPDAVGDLQTASGYNDISLAWRVSPDKDALNQTALYYDIYLSAEKLGADFEKTLTPLRKFGEELPIGSTLERTINELNDNTTYHVAIVATDRFGNKAAPTFAQVATKLNNAPVLNGNLPSEKIILPKVTTHKMDFIGNDADGHKWGYQLTGNTRGISVKRVEDEMHITINPVQEVGEYTFALTLTDEHGKSTTYPFTYEVVKYVAPTLTAAFSPMMVGLNDGNIEVPLANNFALTTGVKATYATKSNDPKVATSSVDGDKLIITPKSVGKTRIQVSVNDGINTLNTDIEVRVVKDANAVAHLVFPIPAHKTLTAILHKDITHANVVVTTTSGEVLINEKKAIGANHVLTTDVSHLAAGTYILILETPKGNFKTSFLKY